MSIPEKAEARQTVVVIGGSALAGLKISELLRADGYLAHDTHDPDEAVEFLESGNAGLAIVDLDASEGIDAEKLSRQIYEMFPDVPLIVCASKLPRWHGAAPNSEFLSGQTTHDELRQAIGRLCPRCHTDTML